MNVGSEAFRPSEGAKRYLKYETFRSIYMWAEMPTSFALQLVWGLLLGLTQDKTIVHSLLGGLSCCSLSANL